MARPSHRETLLTQGLSVVHERGYGRASVRDIVQAAGVPQGSFTNHFSTKEAFGLEILELYYLNAKDGIVRTLRNDELDPLQRLRDFIDIQIKVIAKDEMKRGCLFGNYSAEATDDNEGLRLRLVEIFDEVTASVEYCLKAAVKAGELPPRTRAGELAAFVISSLQGAILLSKAYRSTTPIERFKRILFSSVLA